MTPVSLVLEPYGASNAAWVLEWRNAKSVRRYLIDDTEIGGQAHQRFLVNLASDSSRRYYCVRLDGQRLAALNLHGIGGDAVSWGCFVAGERPVPGLFPALLCLAADFAFKQYGARTLNCVVVEGNRAPQQLNRFLGLEVQARENARQRSGTAVTLLHYRLDRDQWPGCAETLAMVLTRAMRQRLAHYEIQDPT